MLFPGVFGVQVARKRVMKRLLGQLSGARDNGIRRPYPELVGANCGPPQAVSSLSRLLVRMRVSILAMLVPVLAVRVGRGRVLLGLLVLPMGVMMGRLQVMVCGGVVM